MNIPDIFSFPATVYGNLEQYNNVISKARVRIFYKGFNRNNTYITDEFAEKLLSTLSYSPICGIYDNEGKDYTDHGKTRDLGKAYGVVPENPNITWEKHLDDDGIEREYACADVLLWTARYKEAADIVGKGQSMELYSNSIKGEWFFSNGKKYFKFTDACFIGLTPLGDNVEPCFEGAAFYSLNNSLTEMVKELKNYNLYIQNNKGGEDKMVINFKLSDSQKADALFQLLNPNFNEEGNWEIAYGIIDIYDEYVFAYSYEEASYYRVYYTKDDEKNEVVLGEKEKRYIVDINEVEFNALMALKTLNNETYELIDEKYSNAAEEISNLNSALEEKNNAIEDLNSSVESFNATIHELNGSIETLNSDVQERDEKIDAFELKIEELNSTISSLNQEKEILSSYKLEKERQEKKAVISKFSVKLDKDILDEYESNLDSYSLEDLSKELAFKLVDANPALFSTGEPNYIPNDGFDGEGNKHLSPAAELLSKRRKRQNKE